MGNIREIEELDNLVLYDGVCKFCNGSVNFVLDHEKNEELKFTPLQSEIGISVLEQYGFPVDYTDSILFLSGGELLAKSKAAFHISKYMKMPYGSMQVLNVFPAILTDFFYDIIAKNRYKWFGKTDVCMLPPRNHKVRFLESL
ncbi:MAG: DCC1-like thiol-disulfide oxidoreductase family protein [Reichenbachiella sp.]